MVGWVVLSKSWVELTTDSLRARLDRAFPGEFLPPRERGTFVVAGPVTGAQFLINSGIADAAGVFLLNSVPGPYTEVSDFAAHIDDPRLRALAVTQQAWLSVDLVHQTASADDAYRFIGKAIAELAPADAAVLVHPERLVSLRFDDALRRRLAAGARLD
jgi:hypothetical protein